jgi:hypothetical protein
MAAAGAACRSGTGFGGSGTIGRGPSMYEMEGPRPVSRHRPADFSASFAPLNHLPGPGTLPGGPVDRVTGWLEGSPRRGSGFPLCQQAGVSPKPGGAKYFPRQWLRAFSHQMTGVAPKPNGSSFPSPTAQSFLLRNITRGFPSATCLEVFPLPLAQGFLLRARLGVSPPPHALKFSLSRVARGFPLRVSPLPPAPRFPRDQRPQSLPNTGWSGVSPSPVARSFPLAGGAEFPPRRSAGLLLARRPGVVLCRVARGFPFAGYRPWW